MNAVAIRTPVPKCRDKKRNRCGIGSSGKRRAIIGNEHADVVSHKLTHVCLVSVPNVLTMRMRNSAKTWIGTLYAPFFECDPHDGLLFSSCRLRNSDRSRSRGICDIKSCVMPAYSLVSTNCKLMQWTGRAITSSFYTIIRLFHAVASACSIWRNPDSPFSEMPEY